MLPENEQPVTVRVPPSMMYIAPPNPFPPPPAVLPDNVQPVIVRVPPLAYIAPPHLLYAVLPENVQSVTESVTEKPPFLKIAPPLLFARLLENVQSVMVREPSQM